ncbi:MAG TPA: MFS transporter [Candidatus Acidoferrum sp.]|nr:MFS transporter [Candidatus Acidoferrum sp.]
MRTQTNNAAASEVVPKLFWRLMPFLLLLYVVAYLDRINVGFAALQMKTQLHFSDAVYGLGAGIFFAGYFFFQLPSNLILYRVGPRRWIAVMMIAWGIVSSSMMLVATPRGFYALRFLLGATEAGFFPGVILYMKNWFPAGVRARTSAIFLTAGPISGILGGPISGVLLGLDKLHGLAGWQWLFLMEGLPAILLGAIVFFTLADNPREARWMTSEQQHWLAETLRREDAEVEGGAKLGAFAAFGMGAAWLLAFVYFALNFGSYGISLWLPTVFHRASNFGILALGFLTAIPYLLGGVMMILNGLDSDRRNERFWHVAIPAFVAAAGLVGAAYAGSFPVLVACFALAYAGVQCMNGPFWAISSRTLAGAAAPAGIAMINSLGNLGSGLGPYMIGFVSLHTGNFRLPLLLVGAVLAVGGMVVLEVRNLARQGRASG